MALRNKDSVLYGKTYSLYGEDSDTERYYSTVKTVIDGLLLRCPQGKQLLRHVRYASSARSLIRRRFPKDIDPGLIASVRQAAESSLSTYTIGVTRHLKTLTYAQRSDPTLSTKAWQYHLYMLEIELVNRVYRRQFNASRYKFALIAHCLRDFRPECRSVSGEMESVCTGCTSDCYINLGSILFKRFGIEPFISVTMDLEGLFRRIKAGHKSAGALGIACVPELVNGMRLCIDLGIPPVGVPLDANRCARWMGSARETSFTMRALNKLLQ